MKIYAVKFNAYEEDFAFYFEVPNNLTPEDFSKIFTKIFKEISLAIIEENIGEYENLIPIREKIEISTDSMFFEEYNIINKVADKLKEYNIKLLKPKFILYGEAWGKIKVDTKEYIPFHDKRKKYEKDEIFYWWNKV